MSNDKDLVRLWRLETKINMLVSDGKRDPVEVADRLQEILEIALSKFTPNFTLLADLGIITVPDNYDHTVALDRFLTENRRKFYHVNDNLTDANFPNPTRVLKPGDRFHVRAFKQIVDTTTSTERLTFLATQKAIHTGPQGLSLVFEQKRDQLPKGKWYASFDQPDRLWQDADGHRRVPGVSAHSDGDFDFNLGHFERVWHDDSAILCFCDLSAAGGESLGA